MATLPGRRERAVRAGRAAALVSLSGLAGLAAACVGAPEYLVSRGLPLDDAWIHAVYGRSLARTGLLAFNPGVPATGATSPLWAAVLAVPHLLTSSLPALLVTVKLLGFALHLLTVTLLVRAFADGGRVGLAALAGCLLVAFHPDLVSASMSGVEVPLATAAACALLLAARGSRVAPYGMLSLLAPLVRPELSLVCVALPVALFARRDRRRLLTLTAAACLGTAVAWAMIVGRSLAVSGLPLPATFYARVLARRIDAIEGEVLGFTELLGRLPVVDSSILLLAALLMAVYVIGSPAAPASLQRAAAALLVGLLFCAGSFLLVPPVDPRAFAHQRYVLPVLPLLVAAVPVLLAAALERLLPARVCRPVQAAVLVLLVLSLLVVARLRYPVMSAEARKVDEVQVAIGRSLASADPAHVVWAVDAGAVRYFGNAFVVDLVGLDRAVLLGPGGQRFLDRHPPRYFQVAGPSSSLDPVSSQRLRAASFLSSATTDTPPRFAGLREHRLVSCDDPSVSGQVAIRDRVFAFRCAVGAEGRASDAPPR
jgi:hypothetical protein